MLTILGSIGITIIITQSKLFRWLQKIPVFKCSQCVGMWIGVGFYLLKEMVPSSIVVHLFLVGGTVSLFSYTWYLLMKYFIDKYD